ncbi:hypothetical protein G6O67_006328 [Ophiocordyceps sinensis]|uniref:Translation machinery-associated protein 20 n=2 Tax=Ophiocordyceps sinensis TaxID=72228 RepID=A0A8H4LVT2_9HYPO|nr:translation machinery-associated protein 20 [Ophiocordyceps sinensis CO18]KAF4506225.1 hypothetical protein G6O67_006328 [Ophiocordyceps sinensis]
MPLIAPGITSTSGDKTEEWTNKLSGKKLHESESNVECFCKKDLPEEHRIIEPGAMVTKDHKENRLNVYLNEEGVVTHVGHG